VTRDELEHAIRAACDIAQDRVEEAAVLPQWWRERTIAVRDEVGTLGYTGWCLEAHDLAASKLAAFRDKDREFVGTLLVEGMVEPVVLEARVATLPLAVPERDRRIAWVRRTVKG
jgi:hypothetical protein